jgi:hypothetical protein
VDLSSFRIGNIRRVRVVRWGFTGTDRSTVIEVGLEVEDLHGELRVQDLSLAPGGAAVETVERFVAVLNRRLGELHGRDA